MARISMVPKEQLPPDQRRFHDAVLAIRRGPITGPFITMFNSSPDLAARVAHLGNYFHHRGQPDESVLPLNVRTLIAAILSRELDSVYEWAAWSPQAVQAGVSAQAIEAIRDRKPVPGLTEEEELVLDFCDQLLRGNHRLSDGTYQKVVEHFGVPGAVELSATLGYFAMIAFPLNAFEIDPRPDGAVLPI